MEEGKDKQLESVPKSGDDEKVQEVAEEVEGDGGEVVTLGEALEEYEELEKRSNAVLGASDPQNCSYSKGYLKRQALYACLSCNPKNAPFFQNAGVCLACSFKCHDGHELVELYTKRNFRCDCGNKKLPDNPCTLQKDKDDYNEKNVYSQNFSGLYCTCHKPYPDPDESSENADPMLQCVICEDWYHPKHAVPGLVLANADDEDGELVCVGCIQKLEFLKYYEPYWAKLESETSSAVTEAITVSEEDHVVDVDVIKTNDETPMKIIKQNPEGDGSSQDSGVDSLPASDYSDVGKQNDVCPLKSTTKTELTPGLALFLKNGFRRALCRCDSCKAMYESLGVIFLLDEEDTIENYEAKGKEKMETDMMKAEESFNQKVNEMGRVGQIELISGFNHMKESLTDFLKEFADNGKVVQEKDVQEFFENLKASKRPRLDLPGEGY